jgi:hypothetical protein
MASSETSVACDRFGFQALAALYSDRLLAKSLGLSSRSGLAEWLEDGLDPLSQIWKVEPMGWYSLWAGNPRGNPTELMQSDALKTVLEELTPYF